MVELRQYVDVRGKSPYAAWFNGLDVLAAARVTVALERLAQGNQSSLKAVGEGVAEYRIHFGPGYRIYLGKDGDRLIILLGGGSKKRQEQDIAEAKAAWKHYKQRKKEVMRRSEASQGTARRRRT